MKKTIGIIIVLTVILGCSQSGQQNSTEESNKINTNCGQSVNLGDVSICIPVIDGMRECYSNPIIKSRADNLNTEGNYILAYYINNDTYKQINNLDNITFDDYLKVFTFKEFTNQRVDKSTYNFILKDMDNWFNKENWLDVKREIERNFDFLSVGRPIQIESYCPHNNIKSILVLTKVRFDNDEYILLSILNAIFIKEKIIFSMYYRNYNGEESIKKCKSKNDYMALLLLDENK